ncbi:MAG: lipid asymmetry maintenance ABC transporter permease subunit MlaE [Gammaproteobacteria bacterium]|nr:lipid asymmetry maintenance ABC transporter permease subunit MlaE [Gammaproteobacteria bacterium]
MILWIRDLSLTVRGALQTFGAVMIFLLDLFSRSPRTLVRRFPLVVAQIYNAGTLSLTIVMVSGFFVGMVLGLQGFDSLARFGAEDSLGAVAALSLFKELGPVITALLFAGRAGTAIASEIGLMRATDQLLAMEMMAVDPMDRVVTPRFLGGIIAMPLLVAIFNAIGITGTYLIGVSLMGVDSGVFWSQLHANVDLGDVIEGIVKSLIFGGAASLLAVYEGYTCIPSPEGVGRATTRTVVSSAVSVLVLDYLITSALI